MIKFVNAKINIGLNVVGKRPDGYHNLETVFFPVGIETGLPQQPFPFDDILEVTVVRDTPTRCKIVFLGRKIDCPPEKNLVVKVVKAFMRAYTEAFGEDDHLGSISISLDKHLPDGAGLGGGSADASFTLLALNETFGNPFSNESLMDIAGTLGADCPFFILNKPCFASGTGNILTPIDLSLAGKYLLLVKPPVYISTKEAFAGIRPKPSGFNLLDLPALPIEEWKRYVFNDFEASVFPTHPELAALRQDIYDSGALYASMSGSGSSIYGIFPDDGTAASECLKRFSSTYDGVWLFRL